MNGPAAASMSTAGTGVLYGNDVARKAMPPDKTCTTGMAP
jgi:hypothetical protein